MPLKVAATMPSLRLMAEGLVLPYLDVPFQHACRLPPARHAPARPTGRIDPDGAVCRTMGDAPEIDGNLFVDEGFAQLAPGEVLTVEADEGSDFDLWGWRVWLPIAVSRHLNCAPA